MIDLPFLEPDGVGELFAGGNTPLSIIIKEVELPHEKYLL